MASSRIIMGNSREEPVFFGVDGDMLFGVHTHASAPRRGVGVVLIQGGDNVNAALSRNGIGVRLARDLAADGYDVIRFTYHGVGESTGVVETLHLHRPFTADVLGAVDHLRSKGLDSFVVLGSCFGSRTALSSAPDIDGIAGVVLVTPPSAGYDRSEAMAEWMARTRSLSDYAKRGLSIEILKDLLDKGKRQTYLQLARKKMSQIVRRGAAKAGIGDSGDYDWVSPMLLEPLSTMADRKVPVLFLFGTHDAWADEFRDAAKGPLGPILERGAGHITVVDDLPGVAHGLVRVAVQDAFYDVTVDWLTSTVPGTRAAAPSEIATP